MTAFVLGLGATEAAAAVVAAAPQMATGGLVKSRSGGSQIVAGEAGYDEWVVPDTEKVMNGIASRLASIQAKKQDDASHQQSGGGSFGDLASRLVAQVSVPISVSDIQFGEAIINVFDKGYAYVKDNRVVPA